MTPGINFMAFGLHFNVEKAPWDQNSTLKNDPESIFIPGHILRYNGSTFQYFYNLVLV